MKTQQQASGDFDEMIFEKRNKSYGAYMLRRQYGNRLLRAMLSSALLLAVAIGGWAWQQHNSTMVDIPDGGPILKNIIVDLPKPPKEPAKPVEPVKPVTPPPASPAAPLGPKTPELGTPNVVQHADSVPPVNALAGADPGGHKGGQGTGPEQPKHDSIPTGPTAPTGPVNFADQMPENDKLRPYLASSLRFPEIAKSEGISGTVVLKFVVDTLGNVQDLAVEKGVHPSLDKEALRVAKGMPKWIPAVFQGRKVSCYFHLPIKFSLH